MFKRIMNLMVLCVVCIFVGNGLCQSRWQVEIETGRVYSGYNTVQSPVETGTKFSLQEGFSSRKNYYYRLGLIYKLSDVSYLSMGYSPLSVRYTGGFSDDISFDGEDFAGDIPTSISYDCHSYRLSYIHEIYGNENKMVSLGATARLVDWQMTVSNNAGIYANKKQLEFIPQLNMTFQMILIGNLSLYNKVDAMFASKSRFSDLLVALQYDLSERFSFRMGYRLLEDGENTDEEFKSQLFNHLALGLKIRI
ncbi:MAG: hypothetical protein GF307_04845 [candidate division Zixibacteria bacterium]|nr:hypothetical protein [candidate division Zixibacteria bacterium]